ncbi:MAG: hypothetical protein CL578_01325 [Alteromonadaceae bacterium]|nr:hypothetical protein [Alteromonadaceae bacterium]
MDNNIIVLSQYTCAKWYRLFLFSVSIFFLQKDNRKFLIKLVDKFMLLLKFKCWLHAFIIFSNYYLVRDDIENNIV